MDLSTYKLIIVSASAFLFLIAFLVIYRFIFPKRNLPYIFIVFLFSLLPLISILRPGTYESGDLSLHAKFAMAFYESLMDRQFIPRWAGILCGGFGCPHFIFIYTLPYYLISAFHFVGFSFINSVKILLALSYIFSGVTMFYFVKLIIKKELAAFTAAIFYLFAPYHLVDLHYRVAIGEVLAFALLPLVFFTTAKIVLSKNNWWIIANSLFLSFLVTSHLVISTASIPLLIIFATVISWSKNNRLSLLAKLVLSFMLCLLFCAFYIFPILLEGRYTLYGNIPNLSFQQFLEYIYSPWRLGFLFQGPEGELSYIIGYTQLLIVIFSIFIFFKKKISNKNRKIYIFFILSLILIFLLMQEMLRPILIQVPIINNYQMIYRLLLLIAFIVSFIAGIVALSVKNKFLIYFICFLTISFTILNWGNRRNISDIDDRFLRMNITGSSSGHDLIIPKWVERDAEWNIETKNKTLEVLEGSAQVKEVSRSSIRHEYQISVRENTLLKENTYYFPGWNLSVDNSGEEIIYTDKKYPGVMLFRLEPGEHNIVFLFKSTPTRKYSLLISMITIALISLFLIFKFVKSKSKIK